MKRSRSAAPGRTPRGPGPVSFPGGPSEPLPLGASCRLGAGTTGSRRRQLPRTARATLGVFPSKSQSPRGPAARTPGRHGALGLGPGVPSRLRATPRLGMGRSRAFARGRGGLGWRVLPERVRPRAAGVSGSLASQEHPRRPLPLFLPVSKPFSTIREPSKVVKNLPWAQPVASSSSRMGSAPSFWE